MQPANRGIRDPDFTAQAGLSRYQTRKTKRASTTLQIVWQSALQTREMQNDAGRRFWGAHDGAGTIAQLLKHARGHRAHRDMHGTHDTHSNRGWLT